MSPRDRPLAWLHGVSMTMRKAKRERLEQRGWRVGTVEDFLGLSPAEAAYVELRLRLSETLRNRRKSRRLSQTQVARMLHSSQSRVAKMEGGDPSVSLDLLIRSLLALGALRVGILAEPSASPRCGGRVDARVAGDAAAGAPPRARASGVNRWPIF